MQLSAWLCHWSHCCWRQLRTFRRAQRAGRWTADGLGAGLVLQECGGAMRSQCPLPLLAACCKRIDEGVKRFARVVVVCWASRSRSREQASVALTGSESEWQRNDWRLADGGRPLEWEVNGVGRCGGGNIWRESSAPANGGVDRVRVSDYYWCRRHCCEVGSE